MEWLFVHHRLLPIIEQWEANPPFPHLHTNIDDTTLSVR